MAPVSPAGAPTGRGKGITHHRPCGSPACTPGNPGRRPTSRDRATPPGKTRSRGGFFSGLYSATRGGYSGPVCAGSPGKSRAKQTLRKKGRKSIRFLPGRDESHPGVREVNKIGVKSPQSAPKPGFISFRPSNNPGVLTKTYMVILPGFVDFISQYVYLTLFRL